MGKIFSKIQQEYKNARRKVGPGYFRLKKYFTFIETLPVDAGTVLIESKMGKELEWNLIGLLGELADTPYKERFQVWVAVTEDVQEKREKFIERRKMENVRVVLRESEEYYRLLATAGFLLNDSEFPAVFIKREGQKYMKLWDVTPIRATGKSKKKGFGMIGNQQKNFFAADYLFFSNEFALQEVQRDYMLENIATSKALISGYPRNEILFDEEKRAKIREKYGMDQFQTYFYSPVRRVETDTVALKAQREQMIEQLWELDKLLSDHQKVYAKVQQEMADLIDWGGMQHVVKAPGGYSTYEFLGRWMV